MKTNLFAFLAVLFLLSSCTRTESIEEEITETSFFNLKVGNEWAYKTYDRIDFTSDLKFNGRIDSLKIVGEVTLNNKSYSKVRHIKRNVNAPGSSYENPPAYYEYWRVNDKGHLLNLSATNFDQGNSSDEVEEVKHAGRDIDFSHIDKSYYGDVVYKLYPKTNVTVNNQTHEVIPYNGQFTPNSQFPNIIPKIQENNYKAGLGLVKTICHSFEGTYNYEEHLESYSLK